MRALLFLAACSGGDVPELGFVCAGEVACTEPTIGIGGFVSGDGHQLASLDGAVIEDNGGLIGNAVGDAEVIALEDDEVVARGAIHVAALTNLILGGPEGPYLDDESDGIYRVPADRDAVYTVHPMIGSVPSQGRHFYAVTIDGSSELCTSSYCTITPVTSDFGLNVGAGNHVLRFHAYDGGRDFAFRIIGI